MGKIEIEGNEDELNRVSVFLTNNNIKHIVCDDLSLKSNSKNVSESNKINQVKKNSWMEES